MQTRNAFKPAILFYPCNLVGFVRLSLIAAALILWLSNTRLMARFGFILLISLSGLLDMLDGHLARRYNHATLFGGRLDQIIDLTMYSVLWGVSGFVLTVPLLLLEWGVGLLVLRRASQPEGGHWKSALTNSSFWFARQYFAAGQRNALSILANFSHFVFPLALAFDSDFDWLVYLTTPGLSCYLLATVFMLLVLSRRNTTISTGRQT